MCTNANTFTNKIPELEAYVDHHNPWIISIEKISKKLQNTSTGSRTKGIQ